MATAIHHPDAVGVVALAQEVLSEATGTALDRAHAALDRAEADQVEQLHHALERPPEHGRLVELRRDLAQADVRRQEAFRAETAAMLHLDSYRGRRPRGWWAMLTRRRARHDQAERAARLAHDKAQAVLQAARDECDHCQASILTQERFHAGVVAKVARDRRHLEESALVTLAFIRDCRTALDQHPELAGGDGLIAAAGRVRQQREEEERGLAYDGARLVGALFDDEDEPTTPRPPK